MEANNIIDIVGNSYLQNCGDTLKVLRKSEKSGYFDCEFQKYPCIVKGAKREILNGSVNNPQIEVEEFFNKEWLQNCGDTLKIVEKKQEKGKNAIFLCRFKKYPYEVWAPKSSIIKGNVLNPQIEQIEFVDKIWPQYCGDSLKIIEKTDQKTSAKNNHYLWKCEFIKYPCVVYAEKGNILKGVISNPEKENKEFKEKIFKQNCGDELKIIKQISSKENKWECTFLKYPCNVQAYKSSILSGNVDNPELPWKTKDKILKIISNFKTAPTITELANYFGLSYSYTNNLINKYGINNLINYPTISEQEKEIKNFCQEFYSEASSNNQVLKDREIDIYIEKKALGVEFNGNLWHSNHPKYGVGNLYHQEKSLKAQESGIFLFHIFEYEWKDTQKQIILKSLLKSKMSIFDKYIGARKCSIKEISNLEYQNFCEMNHLQGQAGAKVKLGLFYKEKLVQIMSFGVPRFASNYSWEIIRECSKLGYNIIGGKQRLWNFFVKNYNPKDCISYCDFSKFLGNSYLNLGFKKVRLNKPGFVWWDKDTNQVFWRSPEKHSELKDKYLRIYDCGQLVFTWQNEK